MRRTRLTVLAVTALLAVVATSCGGSSSDAEKQDDDGSISVEGNSDFDVSTDLDGAIDGKIAPDTGIGDDDAPTTDDVVQAALEDVDSFWGRSFKGLYGSRYDTISGGYWPYDEDSEQPPCGDPAPDYSEIAENAFYCPQGDLVAWDDSYIPTLYDQYGGFTLGIVFAHEFGHAIQARAGVEGDTIMIELQADCFAGAWTADVADGRSQYFELQLDDLDKAVAGFLELRDGVGGSAEDPQAHGTGFDRIGAFTEGFDGGLDRCRDYPDLYDAGELVIVESPFTDEEDYERGGNLPLDEAVDTATQDLQQFWGVIFGELGTTWQPVAGVEPIDPDEDTVTCGDEEHSGDQLVNSSFYCVPDNTIYLDAVNLVPSLYDIGDYAVATELARQFAYAAEVQLGDTDNSLASNLKADCYAGVYAYSGFSVNRGDDQLLVLSPGDLDEAVIAFVQTSDTSADLDDEGTVSVGTAFTRFNAYRTGFMSGIDACDQIASSTEG